MKKLRLQFTNKYWGERTLPTLNEMINAWGTRSGKFNKGGELKRKIQYGLGIEARQQNEDNIYFDTPCIITFIFVEKDSRRDFDNITGVAHKLILDMLQEVGILKNDNQSVVKEIRDKMYVIKGEQKILVQIRELTQEEIDKHELEREYLESKNDKHE